MAVRFILGRAGSGKSHYCLSQIKQRLLENPEGHPLVLLVPEQATFQAEYALLKSPELTGFIRAQALSFRRLAFRVMQETGGTSRNPINDTGKQLVLFKALYHRRHQLRLFQQSAVQGGFIDRLNELFNEFKRYCISPQHFASFVDKYETDEGKRQSTMLADKLHDIQLIYDDFESLLSAQYIDSEEYLDLLAEQLPESRYIREAELWIDGFYGFTPQEFKVIEQLMQHVKQLNISLCVDREYGANERADELSLFHPTAQTLIQLQEMVDRLGITKEPSIILDGTVPPRFKDRLQLAHIERNYHQRKQWRARIEPGMDAEETSISVHAAVHRRAEVEGTAREMLRLVRDCGYRWRDMAVLVRNAADYQELIQIVFSDHEIPFFFDQKQHVLHHPLIEFIRSALEIVRLNWRYESVFRCVKTEFLLPLHQPDDVSQLVTRRDMDELENYVLAFGLQGTRWTDGKPWHYKPMKSLEEENETHSEQEQLYLQQINHARQLVVKPLLAFQQRLEQAADVHGQVEALFQLLIDVQAADRLEVWSLEAAEQGEPQQARAHSQLWGHVMEMLDQAVEVLQQDEVSLELFCGLIEQGLESIKLAHVPPAMDQVLIGSIDRTRSTQIKASFILGVNDGIMPAKMEENGVLSELERERLMEHGLTMAPGSRRKLLDEQFLIYTALTTPSELLWLSYPLADEEGKALLPSEVIRRLRAMFPQLKTRFILAEPLTMLEPAAQREFIAHPSRALSYLVVQLRQWKQGVAIDPLWWDVYNWMCSQASWQPKLKRMVFGLFYQNKERALTVETSRQLYGEHLQASVSRMEKYVGCPFAHFISYGLRLRERAVYRLEAPDIGQLFHAALSRIAMYLQQNSIHWGDLSQQECNHLAAQAVDELSPRLQSEILLSSKRYAYIAYKLKRIVGRAAAVLGEHARRSGFVPIGVELDFARNGTLPPLQFSLKHGVSMDIIGRIDRVDRAESERGMLLRIIDYKSSQTGLDFSELYYGISLQVLTYLDVVITHAEKWLGQQAIAAGALYFHVHHPIMQAANALPEEKAAASLLKRYKMKGLLLEDKVVIEQMDQSLKQGHSELIPVSIKADGSFYKHSSVASESQWNRLRDHVREKIRSVGDGIASGNVEIKPYRLGTKTPCTFCRYKSICQFDSLFEGNEYAHLKKLSKDDFWRQIEQEGEKQ